jgi:hypothetical protein
MKSIKHIALSAFLTLSAFCAVVYTSCNKDACKGVVCQNGGTCSGGTCTCVTGYEGTNCETKSRDKFVKSWSASDLITGGTSPLAYSASIAAGVSSDITAVIIGNAFSDNFFTVGPINATISGSTITIPSQNPDGNKYSLTGTGTLSAGKITWSYTIKNDVTSVSQVYSGTWQ